MNGFLERVIKASKSNEVSLLSSSSLLSDQQDYAPTSCPALNVALSGRMSGGLTSGLTVLAGASRNGKTVLGLVMCRAYLDRHPDAGVIFLDSEGGSNLSYFERAGIDPDKVVHIPVTNIEQAKFTCVNILEEIKRGDRAVFLFDSVGNVASIKELEDAKDNKSKADMSRAKSLKSFFRIITPYLMSRNIPMVAVNHTYSSLDFFPVEVMSGGQGPLLSANTVLFMGKSKDKDGKKLAGFNFKVKVYKSRVIREGSVFILNIDFEHGLDRNSDLFEAALDMNFIQKSGNSYILDERFGDPRKRKRSEFRFRDPDDEPWSILLSDQDFIDSYEKRYSFSSPGSDDEANEDIIEEEDTDE